MSFHLSASCPRKAQARLYTIINIYRELFHDKLPQNKQYWTLAGPCYDEEERLGNHSEIYQLIQSGLIAVDQYHGIDNSQEIIWKNQGAAPGANFYCGDFTTQLVIQSCVQGFNPGIIHADFTKLKETSVIDTSNIVYLVDKSDIKDIMIVMNFPWNNPYTGAFKGEITPQDVMKLFQDNQRFNVSWNKHWEFYPKCYSYGGTGKRSKTTMCTFILIRK